MAKAPVLLRPVERWLDERLETFVEPRVQRWVEHWLRGAAGRRALADALAEVAVDAVRGGAGGDGLLTEMVVQLNRRLAGDARVRRRLLEALGEHFAPDAAAREPRPDPAPAPRGPAP